MSQHHYTAPVSDITRKDCEILINLALDEDSPHGDPTSESVFSEIETGRACIKAKESGILCGLPVVSSLLSIYREKHGQALSMKPIFRDGLSFEKGDRLFILEGNLRSLLRLERIVLNFVQYLSGISTTVNNAVKQAPENVYVLDTRKTLPGYRKLAKYAVCCGGGSNHRISLSDMAMIKDNHIQAAGSIKTAVEKIRRNFPDLPLEVEVDHPDQIREVLPLGVNFILLDNMPPGMLKDSITLIRSHLNPPVIEISGNRNPSNLHELSGLGKLGVSMGFLTHTTRFLDLSMEME